MHAATNAQRNDQHNLCASRALRVVSGTADREVRLSRGQTLFYAEDKACSFFDVVEGTLRCCRLMHDGQRQVFRFAGAGELVGISAEGTYGYAAEAVGQVVVRRRRLADLEEAMAEDGVLRRRVLQSLRRELVATRAQMMLLGRMNATARLASFLVALAGEGRGGDCVDLPMSRSDIADYLGLALETVSRKFGELATLGVIRLETPQRVRIVDPDRMKTLAEAA